MSVGMTTFPSVPMAACREKALHVFRGASCAAEHRPAPPRLRSRDRPQSRVAPRLRDLVCTRRSAHLENGRDSPAKSERIQSLPLRSTCPVAAPGVSTHLPLIWTLALRGKVRTSPGALGPAPSGCRAGQSFSHVRVLLHGYDPPRGHEALSRAPPHRSSRRAHAGAVRAQRHRAQTRSLRVRRGVPRTGHHA
jgi:hypothetical protein